MITAAPDFVKLEKRPRHFCILSKDINIEWRWTRVDDPNCLVHILDREDWEDRTKDFLPHDWRVGVDVDKNSGRNKKVIPEMLTAVIDAATVEETHEPIKMSRVHDATVVGTLSRVDAVKIDCGLLEMLEEALRDILEHKNVVGRSAGLPEFTQRPCATRFAATLKFAEL